MIKKHFKRVCAVAGIVVLGACTQKTGKPDSDSVRELNERTQITRFIEESYGFGPPAISVSAMTGPQRANVLRFIALSKRGAEIATEYNAIINDFRHMERPHGDDNAERITRHDYLNNLAALNTLSDIMLGRFANGVLQNQKYITQEHAGVLKSCIYLGNMREMEPVIDADTARAVFPGKYLAGTYFDARVEPQVTYSQLMSDDYEMKRKLQVSQILGEGRFADFEEGISAYEALVTRFERIVENFREGSKPGLADIKAQYARYRHKELLMRVNYEFCESAVGRLERREGAFSNIPGFSLK